MSWIFKHLPLVSIFLWPSKVTKPDERDDYTHFFALAISCVETKLILCLSG